jgi:hypothetical protein
MIYYYKNNQKERRFMWKKPFIFILSTLVLSATLSAHAWDKGIYLTQYTLEKSDKLDYLIQQAKITGINTFIIDHEYYSSHYAPAIAKVKAAGLKNVTRIVVFSDGGNAAQIHSQAHWEEKYKLVEDAIKAGADVVQLDYIRYSSKEPANPQHAKDVYEVIKWFKKKINAEHTPMEIDIFGEVSYYPSMHIGQDIKMFADSVDGVNPMVYPSHFWPYQKYSAEPYKTVNNSLNSLVGQFNDNAPFKVHAFIEAANYHYLKKISDVQKQEYLLQEIRAVEDAKNVSGWYVWSANNVYENLFHVLKNNKTRSADFASAKVIQTSSQNENIHDKKRMNSSAKNENTFAEAKIDDRQLPKNQHFQSILKKLFQGVGIRSLDDWFSKKD